MDYAEGMRLGIKIAKETAPPVSQMSDEDLAASVAEICETLRGAGVGPIERIALNEDRHRLRKEQRRRARVGKPTDHDG